MRRVLTVIADRPIDPRTGSPSVKKDSVVIRRRELIAFHYVTNRPLDSPRKEFPQAKRDKRTSFRRIRWYRPWSARETRTIQIYFGRSRFAWWIEYRMIFFTVRICSISLYMLRSVRRMEREKKRDSLTDCDIFVGMGIWRCGISFVRVHIYSVESGRDVQSTRKVRTIFYTDGFLDKYTLKTASAGGKEYVRFVSNYFDYFIFDV